MTAEPDIVTTPEAALGSALTAAGSDQTRELLRYFIASAAALIADAGSLYVLADLLSVPYLYAGAAAFALGLIIVYVLSIVWVFEHRSSRTPWVEFIIFALIGIIGLALNEAVLYILTGLLGWYVLVSKAASVVVVFSWNFIARKRILFAHA